MSTVISGTLVIVVFLLVASLTFGAVLGTTSTQGASLRDASESRVSQVAAAISISSTLAADSSGGTHITVTVANTGTISYGDFSNMDVITKYLNSTGDQEVKRLVYVCKDLCGAPGNPGDNQWTISGISPDSYNPKMWDPDESATMLLRVVPVVKAGSSGTVVVVVPGGVSDATYFSN